MLLTGAQITIETLIEQGCKVLFGYPGGQVIDLYDALYEREDRIKHVLTAHEQGACHAADGYARASGQVGVVMATSGPGATNLVTGIATAYLDSIPLVAITGNVPNSLIGRDSFQEVDITGITLPITKHNFIVKNIEDLADTIREAFKIAKSGRPGPVLVDIPKDVQQNRFEYTPHDVVEKIEQRPAKEYKIEKAAKMLMEANRPYIYVGGGAITADATEEIIQLANTIDAVIGSTLMGLSVIPGNNERFLGMEGMHGDYASSIAQDEADLILTIGARFSDRATGNVSKYATKAKIIHIDIDRAEVDKNVSVDLGVGGDLKQALNEILKLVKPKENIEWQNKIKELKEFSKKSIDQNMPKDELNPYTLIKEVSKHTSDDTKIVTDVGQHQMWVAQYYEFKKPRTFITSGGLGTMGFGLGAAIGSAMYTNEQTVLFTGDGSFGMNLNELATVATQNLPIVIILMNNGVLGMVRQWQNLFFDKHYSQTVLERKTDFVKLAEAFGIKGYRISNVSQMKDVIDQAFKEKGPVLVDCYIDKDEFVLPMLPPGGSFEDIITIKEDA
ncbi:biosynthetic-type acetolactate synthase large subunit [Faecalitalea cylindroides]|uniref:biosynthetic-type acetolactate synthase large subunit n=1 Tax=Faecalitalea cylindroides TaxID=39483 RepID=UPI00189A6D2A|nr:biosynthetic-type acetolactate synthase large subunit [Faecalitalea cylindroides]MDB7946556.1 biosynthetic-type acetolactate synthase large subunit [Faecalitalea cylindroides]MDB7948418.1 biosynthetic-type acetolactate synthase large subunit [Faecalitalea cylindroides]MDB7950337.1 biosynthetic-type acetolactate synthase large subunit [Faecalitalea cylindroides]